MKDMLFIDDFIPIVKKKHEDVATTNYQIPFEIIYNIK